MHPWRLPGVCPQTILRGAQGFYFTKNQDGQTEKRNQSSLKMIPYSCQCFSSCSTEKDKRTHRRNNGARILRRPHCIFTYRKNRRPSPAIRPIPIPSSPLHHSNLCRVPCTESHQQVSADTFMAKWHFERDFNRHVHCFMVLCDVRPIILKFSVNP